MTEPYVAQVQIFGFNFAPRDWAFCNGAQMAISQNQALFSLIGTTYGGNGMTTYALPNIQDGGVMNIGQGPGLSNYDLGQHSGASEVGLNSNQIPNHTHGVSAMGAKSTDYELAPKQNYWIGTREGGAANDTLFSSNSTPGASFGAQVISIAGSSTPHQNEQPYLGMNFCIALYGVFPSRN